MMNSADAVLCLTNDGASNLGSAYGSEVTAIPFAIGPRIESPPKRREIFVPGYTNDAEGVAALVKTVCRWNKANPEQWMIRLSAYSPEVEGQATAGLKLSDLESIDLMGYLSEDELMEAYVRASIVVRLHVGSRAGNSFAVSGPLPIAVSQGCLCITNDDRSGSRELAANGLVIIAARPDQELWKSLARWPGQDEGNSVAIRAQQIMGIDATARAYAAATGLSLPDQENAERGREQVVEHPSS